VSAPTAEDALMEALQAIRARLIQHDEQILTLGQKLAEVTDLLNQFAGLTRRYLEAR